ncbi:hypothetical protein CF15_01245 [Pyrodictium occultum]|uniref:Isopropylmalate dehydrogenase-like domain-containing protein n=1 Tax=Pyrodictium occultum TaxID=2309 RepID=A0A0V8RTV5_PYROC|nr:isocitrate/isopropylmalate dehydrogenase family protein [Pyrodictium occultum]KSW11500.1 hypothetical protein CF15_01245 [Pyrodictium occultum]
MAPPRVLVIPGDGIGPEITRATMHVLERVMDRYGVELEMRYAEAGDTAAEKYGEPLPRETLALAKNWADVVLKGPVGETAGIVVVGLRRELGVYANIRPARSLPGVASVAPIDLVIVRENLEDVYAGIEFSVPGAAFAVKVVTEAETRRVARIAARYARARSGRVTIVHKANVLRVADGLFRSVARKVLEEEGVEVDEMYVDAAAMEMVRNPTRFDVVLTMNQYGDILSDLAAQVAGGIGLAPSANLGDEKALFEPVHGAAWDIAGKGIANPTAMILSAAMMLRHLGYQEAALAVERAVEQALEEGYSTPDLGGSLTTMEYAKAVTEFLG